MSRFDQLRELIDACRPGSRDLAAPELAVLSQAMANNAEVAAEFARSQAFDGAVTRALIDVPVPEGLVDRLLAAAADASAVEPPSAGKLEAAAEPAKRRRFHVRRWQLLAGASLAISLLLGIVIYQRLPPKVVTQQELSSAVASWLTQVQPAAWTPLVRGTYPRSIAQDSAVPAPPQSFQAIRFHSPAGWSANVTALNLSPPGRPNAPQALLFVVRSSARFIVPANPASTKRMDLSRGMKAVAWQRMNSPWLYVLAVEEVGGQKLDHYLQATQYTIHEPPQPDESL